MPEKQKQRISVINNDTDFLSLISAVLQDEGYDVVTCRVGHDALDFVRKSNPDLIILDLRLDSEVSGWEVLELLRLAPEVTQVPILVCSAATDLIRKNEQRIRDHRCDILQKPFDLDELITKVKRLLANPTALA